MNSKFIFILSSLFFTIILSIFVLIYVPFLSGFFVYDFFQIVLIILLIVISVWTLQTILTVTLLWYNKKAPRFMKKSTKKFLVLLFPLLEWTGDLWRMNKDYIRQAYMDLNNELVLREKYKFEPKDILVMSPHCLQNSSCQYKVTNDINNCRKCGKCNVDNLLQLQEKYGINLRIVSGGTLARMAIKEVRPKAIVAVACERDLVSGLNDIRHIPVVAVINQRPNGPCIDTSVDIDEVERAIQSLL